MSIHETSGVVRIGSSPRAHPRGGPMAEMQWIPIGRGSQKAELEKVIEMLKRKWSSRYDYRIEQGTNQGDENEPYRLLVRHR